METLKKVLIVAGVACFAVAIVIGATAEEVNAAVTLGIGAGAAIAALIGAFLKKD
jgi:hypothetical protein